MQLINNQDVLLFDELCEALTADAEVRICTSYLSIPALFELSDYLEKVKSIDILIDNKHIEKDIRFSYDETEWKSYFQLKSKFQADKIKTLIQTAEREEGNFVGFWLAVRLNNSPIRCFILTALPLGAYSSGSVAGQSVDFVRLLYIIWL